MLQFVKVTKLDLTRLSLCLLATAGLLWPMFAPGPLLTLDHLASPIHMVSIFGVAIPSALAGKLLLAGALFSGLTGLLVLLRRLQTAAFSLVVLFWTLMPFWAERLAVGQWDLLFAVGLVPWILAGLEALSRRRYYWLLPTTLVALWMIWQYPRGVSFLELIALSGLIGWILARRHLALSTRIYVGVGLATGGLVLLQTLVRQVSDARADIANPDQFALFAVGVGDASTRFVGALNYLGFWAERAAQLPYNLGSHWFWLLPAFVLLPITVLGWQKCIERQPWLGWTVVALYVLSLGTVLSNSGLVEPDILQRGYALLGFIGLRETGKFMGLMLVAQAIGLGWGVQALLRSLPETTARYGAYLSILAVFLIYLPIVTAITKPSLTPVTFPPELITLAKNANERGDRVIMLPWHRYQAYPFTKGRIVDQLGPVLFTEAQFNEMLEYDHVRTASSDPWQQRMATVTSQDPLPKEELSQLLQEHTLDLAVIMKTNDYAKFLEWAEIYRLPLVADTVDFAAYRLSPER